jgi:hypothetical protein
MLVIMGSGETSPTMVKTHREVFARLGATDPAVLLDTPFGFQENVDDISAKAIEYFRTSVGRNVTVASFRRARDLDPVAREATLAAIRAARWVFAGPGSPTYTLRQWAGSEIPDLLADKLAHGGVVTFASAAALTLGRVTVPVYEIYKSGADPTWAEGLDLLGPLGLPVAVIPHYDNAEGGNHDTRFCYLGERRLRILEAQLPPGSFVLGIDEHTGLVLDLDDATATVVGLGQVTVRREGRSAAIASGATVPISALTSYGDADLSDGAGADMGAGGADRLDEGDGDGGDGGGSSGGGGGGGGGGMMARAATPLMATIREHEEAFDRAIADRDIEAAVRAILELDDALAAWGADTLQSDEHDRGRGALRRMVVRLGAVARIGARDPRQVVGPYVERLLALRDAARQGRRFAEADDIRDQLVALGVSIHDTAAGTEWDPPADNCPGSSG